MMTSTTLKEYRAELAQRNVSADDRLKHLIVGSDRLTTHQWTDAQIQAIPEDLVMLAYEQSATLQQEFGDLATFLAYRRAHGKGLARIAGRT